MTVRTTTANTPDVYGQNARLEELDEIDLRRYVLVVLRWWREILLFSLLVGGLTGAVLVWLNLQQPPIYIASADIVITRLASDIELDERISTTTGTSQTDPNGWRTSLLQLSRSSVVAQAVFDELKGELPSLVESPEMLAAMIEASVPLSPDERYASNLIRISATTTSPDLSAQIANSWARHLVDFINGLYGEVPETTVVSVTTERDRAFAAYQAAEKAYEAFVADNQIDSLSRQIGQKSTLRSEIMANYTRMVTTVVSSEYNMRLDRYSALATTPTNQAVNLIATQARGTADSLAALYQQRIAAQAQLSQARSMEANLVDGGEAAAKSNAAALQLLKLTIFAADYGVGNLPLMLPTGGFTQQADMTLDEQLTDVRSLIMVLETRLAQLDDDITQLAQGGTIGAPLDTVGGLDALADSDGEGDQMSPLDHVTAAYSELLSPNGLLNQAPVDIDSAVKDAHEEVLATLEREISALQAAITAENAKQRELTHQRDMAWTTYDTIGNKLEELNLLRSSANTEVRIGNPALVPFAPEPQNSPVLPVIALTIVAFFFAIVVTLLVDSLGINPIFARRPA